MKYRVRHVIEFVLLVGITRLMGWLPYRVALTVGWIIAGISYLLGRRRVLEAKRRIHEVFGPSLPPARLRHIAWISWRNIIFAAVDSMRAPRIDQAWLIRHTNVEEVLPRIAKYFPPGRGGILSTAHMGSWELAGIGIQRFGFSIAVIAARQRNPLTDAYVNRLRESVGIVAIPRGPSAARAVLREIQNGRILAILPDVRMASGGIALPFLGKIANVGTGIGVFAHHADVTVVPALIHRHGWTRHECRIYDPIVPDPGMDKVEDAKRITLQVLRIVEQSIQAHPEQWWWYNKRWILEPVPQKATPAAPASDATDIPADSL